MANLFQWTQTAKRKTFLLYVTLNKFWQKILRPYNMRCKAGYTWHLFWPVSVGSTETGQHLVSVYSCLSIRSRSNNLLLSKGYAGKPVSNQHWQPVTASADQCVLAGEESLKGTSGEIAALTLYVFSFFFSFFSAHLVERKKKLYMCSS